MLLKQQFHQNWTVTNTEKSPKKENEAKSEMSPKLTCQQKRMSTKLKCQQNRNVTRAEMLQSWIVAKTEKSPKLQVSPNMKYY